MIEEICNWREKDIDWGGWETDCGQLYDIIEGVPSDNGMKFCTFCGKKLVEHPFKWDDSGDS